MVVGQAFSSFACLFLNTYYTGKYFNYGIIKQLKDIFIFLFVAISLCGITLFAVQSFYSNWIQLIVGTILYTGTYLAISKLFKFEELKEVVSILLKPFNRVSPELIS